MSYLWAAWERYTGISLKFSQLTIVLSTFIYIIKTPARHLLGLLWVDWANFERKLVARNCISSIVNWHCPFLCKVLWAYLWPRYSTCQPHYCSTIKYIQVRTLLKNSSKDDQINLNSLWTKARHLHFLCKSIVSVFVTKIHYCQPHYCSTIKYIQVKNTLNNSSKDDQILEQSLNQRICNGGRL